MKKYLSIVLVLIYSIMSSNKHLKMNRFHNNELQQISLKVQYFNFPNFISNSKEENTNNFLLSCFISFLGEFKNNSFYLTLILSLYNSKKIVFAASFMSLCLIKILSLHSGTQLINFFPENSIEFFNILIFLFLGVQLLIKGSKLPKDSAMQRLEYFHRDLNFNEEQHNLNHQNYNEIENNNELIRNREKMNKVHYQFKAFVQTFFIIFIDKISDKSQMSRIFHTSNPNSGLVLVTFLFSNLFLLIFAVLCAEMISFKISHKYKTISAGVFLITLGFLTFYLTFFGNLFKPNSDFIRFHMIEKIPLKEELAKTIFNNY